MYGQTTRGTVDPVNDSAPTYPIGIPTMTPPQGHPITEAIVTLGYD